MMEKVLPPSKPGPVHAQAIDDKVKSIPLPTQLPKSLDFSEIPMAAIKSATLESLISQNEDLMARLSVALRKINELEEANAHIEREKKTIHTRFQTLKEQFLLLEAKDRSATGRAVQQHEENVALRQQNERLEKLYSELYHQATALQKRLVRLERYRARVRKVSPALQAKAKRILFLETEIVGFRRSLGAQKIALSEEYEAKAAEYENRIQTLRQEMAELKTDLETKAMQAINSYETRLAEARQETEALRTKAAERDQLYEDLLKAENQKIFEQRQFEQSRKDFDQTIGRLEGETGSLRQQLKDALVDRESKIQELTRLTAEIPNLRERNQNLVEQVESLQSLWNHKQRELEQNEEKNKSLQKLNQSLSVTLNQQRKEIHQLQLELDKERFTAGEKIKNLITEIQLLRSQVPADGTGGADGGGGAEKL